MSDLNELYSDQDLHWMMQALGLARQAASEGEVPVGALVVREGKLLGRGWNRPIGGVDPTAHAEMQALRDAAKACQNYRLPGSTLYVSLEPCAMCVGAIIHARIERLVFAALEPRAGAVCSHLRLLDQSHFNHSVRWSGGLLAEESAVLLRDFFRARR